VVWKGGWIHASVYSLRVSNLTEASNGAPRRVTATVGLSVQGEST
jgi:hypothetical protein